MVDTLVIVVQLLYALKNEHFEGILSKLEISAQFDV